MDHNKRAWSHFSVKNDENFVSSPETLDIRETLSNAVNNKAIPGAVFTLACHGKTICKEVVGHRQVTPHPEPMTNDTIFDLASLTKVVATWPAILILLQNKLIELDAPVSKYLHELENSLLGEITILDLLTHTSGLPERTYLRQYGKSKQDIIRGFCDTGLKAQKGKRVLYSNRGFILLGFIIEEITHRELSAFVTEKVWRPLQMKETFFTPSASCILRIAPTEYREALNACQRGTVHDENADWLGGIAGHAGVFSTINDLSRFCAAILAGGRRNDKQVLNDQWIDKSLTNYTSEKNETRGLAWEMLKDENYHAPFWGHTGFTGTSIWINPELDAFAILLTNRIHPNRDDQVTIKYLRNTIRRKCWDIVQNQNDKLT